ncbi:MAG TPA: cytochrome P450, partial [Solirubrobacteraceae bacterium]|nr:cytochrome P450 [Solirubrobacteraceae bacterium]
MTVASEAPLSLYHLLDPEVLADPYPLYRKLRAEDPVHWDPYLHAWVVTRYAEVVEVLHRFSAKRTPTPERLAALGMEQLAPIACVMVRQMLFLDPPQHSRVRGLAAVAFTPRRVKRLRAHIEQIADSLIDAVSSRGEMEVMQDLANPLPAIVTAEMLGVPTEDHRMLKDWSEDFAEMLGNFQHNPGRADKVAHSLQEMTAYFHEAVRRQATRPTEGLINALTTAEVDGDRLTEEEVVANAIVTLVGGQETTTNLIGNGLLTLLRHPEEMERLRRDPALVPTAVEELLRFESPSQHTARLAPDDVQLGGRPIKRGQAVIAVMGAANRDGERFPDPDRLDLARVDNRHLAFGWAGHFCFGAPLARLESEIAFSALLHRLPGLRLAPGPITWRSNLGLRGLAALPVSFQA